MKRATLIICLLSASLAQAQTLYVNNSDNTHLAFDTNGTEVTFDEKQQLVMVRTQDGAASQFATTRVTEIAPESNNGNALTYNLTPKVSFNTADASNYNEIVETIITDELDDESGDFVENYDSERTITITFSKSGVKTSSLPSDITAIIDGGHIVINSMRSKVAYRITGSCENGSLKIYSLKKFQVIMQNLNLTNPTGPAINIQSGKTVYMTIPANSTNTLCDGATYNAPVIDSNGEEEDQKGTLFSEGQLIFNGEGTLNVTSLGGHGICSDDYIRVRSGNINVLNAAKDGFRTKEKFVVGRTASAAPTITVNATNNGIDCSEGTLTIEAGKLDIKSGSEGIKVEYEELVPDPTVIPDAYIKGGFIKIATTGEKSSAIKTTRNYTQSGGIIQATVSGNGSKIINCDGAITFTGGKLTGLSEGTVTADETSAGGVKSEGTIEITGGTIAIDCTGKGSKGMNCTRGIVIEDGDITLLATAGNYTEIADDKKSRAMTANSITVNGGKIVASAHDNALAATIQLTVNGGSINAYSNNSDALNMDATQTGGWLLTKDAE
ncbi:MAG: carbohydrate-binding domain-containing protein [Bacteroidaceae bacterium]|nr:carbohydrate-binding domain-containing protein [Bacteroidaceae bacterium]